MPSNKHKADWIKQELKILDDQEQILEQNLSFITSRKINLKTELESLGYSSSLKSPYHVLSKRQVQELKASLTK